jgi:hypothetical protein
MQREKHEDDIKCIGIEDGGCVEQQPPTPYVEGIVEIVGILQPVFQSRYLIYKIYQ